MRPFANDALITPAFSPLPIVALTVPEPLASVPFTNPAIGCVSCKPIASLQSADAALMVTVPNPVTLLPAWTSPR